jgi:hypothetical protein
MSKSVKNKTILKQELTAEEFQSFHRPLNLDLFPEKLGGPSEYSELIIESGNLPLYGDIITIPNNCIFWRGYDAAYPIISNRPAYYGSRETANAYAYTNLGCFTNTKQLKLIDIHFMKVILKQLLDDIKLKKECNLENNTAYDINELQCISYMTVSFGLCSLFHQLELIKKIYPESEKVAGFNEMTKYYNNIKFNMIEQSGFRVAETNIDGITMNFLKTFFKGFVDGFIAPRVISPFHVEKKGTNTPEIIIFNPLESGIQLLQNPPQLNTIDKIYIHELVAFKKRIGFIGNDKFMTGIYLKIEGGNLKKRQKKYKHPIDEFNSKIENNDKYAIQLSKIGEKYGKLWKDEYFFPNEIEPSVPKYKLNKDFMIIAGSIIKRPLSDNK